MPILSAISGKGGFLEAEAINFITITTDSLTPRFLVASFWPVVQHLEPVPKEGPNCISPGGGFIKTNLYGCGSGLNDSPTPESQSVSISLLH